MHYFLTGATGFIGKFLTERLLNRGGHVHVLVRPGSELKFTALKNRFPLQADRLHAVTGDLSMVGLGLTPEVVEKLASTTFFTLQLFTILMRLKQIRFAPMLMVLVMHCRQPKR